MFKIEVDNLVTYTATLSDDEEEKIKKYINDNEEEFQFMSEKQAIVKAVKDLDYECELELYKDVTETDSQTYDIRWSEFEDRKAEDILDTKK